MFRNLSLVEQKLRREKKLTVPYRCPFILSYHCCISVEISLCKQKYILHTLYTVVYCNINSWTHCKKQFKMHFSYFYNILLPIKWFFMQFSSSSTFYVLCTFIKFESVFYSIISDSIFAFLSIQSLSTNAATAFGNLLTGFWDFEINK